jgi:hypothetical protein
MMSNHVEHAALLRCQFGSNNAPLNVEGPWPLASVRDFQPFSHIQPFGACVCPGNPQVQAATAAAGGVLTPSPCLPAVDDPWLPGTTKMMVGGAPGLAPDSTARCRWGGVIELVQPRPAKSGASRG